MATDIVKKVESLIALTDSDNVNEAKTAALQACRIIREHKLRFTKPIDTAGPVRAEQHRRTNGSVHDMWEELFKTVSYQANTSPPPRKPFCDGCKTECQETSKRGKQRFCAGCCDDFDRVMNEDRERREREHVPYYGASSFKVGIDGEVDMWSGTFSNEFTRSNPFDVGLGRVNDLRAAMGLGPLTEEEFMKSGFGHR